MTSLPTANSQSKFLLADFRAVEIARHYYDETKIPFVVSVGKNANWDCKSFDGSIRIEIKFESTPSRTGNICLEYWNSHLDQPSGVLGTDCTLWVHIVPEGSQFVAIEYDIDRLRKLVIEEGRIASNGHDAVFKLISLTEFRKKAKRVFTFESIIK